MSVFPEFVSCCAGQLGLGGCSDAWRAAAAAAAVWPERFIMVVESRGTGIEPEVLQKNSFFFVNTTEVVITATHAMIRDERRGAHGQVFILLRI
jgi:hypothetical protein